MCVWQDGGCRGVLRLFPRPLCQRACAPALCWVTTQEGWRTHGSEPAAGPDLLVVLRTKASDQLPPPSSPLRPLPSVLYPPSSHLRSFSPSEQLWRGAAYPPSADEFTRDRVHRAGVGFRPFRPGRGRHPQPGDLPAPGRCKSVSHTCVLLSLWGRPTG